MRDKRAQFFLLAALVCFALVPLADDQFREPHRWRSASPTCSSRWPRYLDYRSRQ